VVDNLFWALLCTGGLGLGVAMLVAFFDNEDKPTGGEYNALQVLLALLSITGFTTMFYILLAVG
jgi:hypothetical protein